MPRITEMYAFVCHVRGDPEDEGVMAFQSQGQWFPMVASDAARVMSLVPMANRTTDRPWRIVKFGSGEDVTERFVHLPLKGGGK